ncbi:MAG: hydrogenase maturation nickel metallochaperone HypA [Candidatus Thorarchaeota archaeon]|nr:MAG: hydrogenase maturation nickel metallochaperone HypA [Candidatus Thorarchaeota archaeon]
MHEFSAACAIVDAALQAAESYSVKKITTVNVEVGEFTFLVPEQLQFNFEIASKKTLAEDATLNINLVKGRIKCDDCGYQGEAQDEEDMPPEVAVFATLKCPSCQSSATTITGGKDFVISNIEAETDTTR